MSGRTVLGIDTAGPVVGAAIWRDGACFGAWSLRVVKGADAHLLPAIAALLDQLRSDGGELDAVAVSHGPGAFTGLRVGVATALGLAVARGLPVAPISSLAARAALADGPSVLALLDARKGRVYAGWFDCGSGLPEARSGERDAVLDAVVPPSPFVAVGEGAQVHAEAIAALGGVVVSEPDASPAAQVARLGASAPLLAPAAVQLRYLRPPDARLPAPGKGEIHPPGRTHG